MSEIAQIEGIPADVFEVLSGIRPDPLENAEHESFAMLVGLLGYSQKDAHIKAFPRSKAKNRVTAAAKVAGRADVQRRTQYFARKRADYLLSTEVASRMEVGAVLTRIMRSQVHRLLKQDPNGNIIGAKIPKEMTPEDLAFIEGFEFSESTGPEGSASSKWKIMGASKIAAMRGLMDMFGMKASDVIEDKELGLLEEVLYGEEAEDGDND